MHSKSNIHRGPERSIHVAFDPALIADSTVARILSPKDVLGVIAGAFVEPPVAPPRTVAEWVDGPAARAVLAMPALRPGGIAIVKVVNSGRSGLYSQLLAFDERGALLAVVEAHRLTALRTAAASVLAAQTLGAGGARRLAVLGAGRQAKAHIESFAVAAPIETVTVWARRDEAARDLAAFAAEHIPTVRIAPTPRNAAVGADIVSSAIPSVAPLLTGDMISAGTHVDLVGGFRPDMREADDALLARAAIVADTAAALSEAGDLVQPSAAGTVARAGVVLLADILTGHAPVPRAEVTLFKSVGHAAEDLVVMELLLGRLGLLPDAQASVAARGGGATHV
jgi:ornithine cyclodeaminase